MSMSAGGLHTISRSKKGMGIRGQRAGMRAPGWRQPRRRRADGLGLPVVTARESLHGKRGVALIRMQWIGRS